MRSKSVLTDLATLVIVLFRKWLQPSGFTQNVQRTQRIVGQDMILQSLGAVRSHNLDDKRWTDAAHDELGRIVGVRVSVYRYR